MVGTLISVENTNTSLREIFKWNRRYEANPQCFSKSKLPISLRAWALLRFFLFSYWLAILVASFVSSDEKRFFFTYLSHLHQIPILLYLLGATACSMLDCVGDEDRVMFHTLPTAEGGSEGGPPLKWLHWATWVLHSVSFDVALLVSAMYPFLNDADTKGGSSFDASFVSINIHVINLVIMLWELLTNRVPVNFWHFPATCAFSLLYAVILAALHFSGARSAVYSVIDYENAPLRAWAVTAAMLVPGPMLSHICMCLLYALKIRCFKQITKSGGKSTGADSPCSVESVV